MDDSRNLEWVLQRHDHASTSIGEGYIQHGRMWHTMMEHQMYDPDAERFKKLQQSKSSMPPTGIEKAVRNLREVHKHMPGEFRILNLRTLETIYPTHLGL